jgi:hypothetical protein
MLGVLLRAIGFLLAGNPAAERDLHLSDGNFMQPCRKLTLHPGAGRPCVKKSRELFNAAHNGTGN